MYPYYRTTGGERREGEPGEGSIEPGAFLSGLEQREENKSLVRKDETAPDKLSKKTVEDYEILYIDIMRYYVSRGLHFSLSLSPTFYSQSLFKQQA